VRGLEIFFPGVGNAITDAEVETNASEPKVAKRQEEFLEDHVRKLEDGHEIFRRVLAGRNSIRI